MPDVACIIYGCPWTDHVVNQREHERTGHTRDDFADTIAHLRRERDRMLPVLEAARGVAELLRLLDAAGFDGSLTGPSRALVVALNACDDAEAVDHVRS